MIYTIFDLTKLVYSSDILITTHIHTHKNKTEYTTTHTYAQSITSLKIKILINSM